MKDLCCLTGYYKVEFALFRRPGTYIVYRGTARGISISNDDYLYLLNNNFKWIGHTHVGDTFFCLYPSDGDYDTLKKMNQRRSVIYNSIGDYHVFGLE